MTGTSGTTFDDSRRFETAETAHDSLPGSAIASFLAAGGVLFASLAIGTSGSLWLTGSDTMMAAIEQMFL